MHPGAVAAANEDVSNCQGQSSESKNDDDDRSDWPEAPVTAQDHIEEVSKTLGMPTVACSIKFDARNALDPRSIELDSALQA